MWNRRRCGESFGLGWVDLNRRERERERSFRIDRLVCLPFSPSSPLPTYKVHVEVSSLLPPFLLPQTTTTAAAVSQSEKTTTKTKQNGGFFCFFFFFSLFFCCTMESFPSNFYQEPASHNPFSWTDNTVLRRRIGRSNHLQKIEPGQMLDCLHTVGCIRHIIRSFRLVTVSVFSLFLVCMCIQYIYGKGGRGEYVHASCHQPRTDSLPSLDPSRQRR